MVNQNVQKFRASSNKQNKKKVNEILQIGQKNQTTKERTASKTKLLLIRADQERMPHTNHTATTTSSSGDDLGSTDEVKVFKDEGDREDEKISSENLLEEKSSLIDLTESEVSAKNRSSMMSFLTSLWSFLGETSLRIC